MGSKYDWLNKKTPRSVDQLRPWADNPRLNPEETHITLSDFAEDLTVDPADRREFYALINSIVSDGFVPADPVVVWKDPTNDKYYVAEGNRRIIALKLLRDPQKAPKNIRGFIRKASSKINLTTIEKIQVNIAPAFEDAEWYINQRNSSSSLQRRWSSEQQRRWIETLFIKYEGNIEKLLIITKLESSELENIIRILKLKDFVKLDCVKSNFSEDESAKASSHKFPITVLERFFNFIDVREAWGVEFNGFNVDIISNKESFYNAYTELIRKIISSEKDNMINTRIVKENLSDILANLPKVTFAPVDTSITPRTTPSIDETPPEESPSITKPSTTGSETTKFLKGNPNRTKIILPIYTLNTSNCRLLGIFDELKKMSVSSYKNCVASALRIFLDLAVFEYIESEGLADAIGKQYNRAIQDVRLKQRLEYLKANKLKGKPQTIVSKLTDSNNPYTLDVLNGYMHSMDTCFLNKEYLNSFWDFLFPLFQVLIDINEIDE